MWPSIGCIIGGPSPTITNTNANHPAPNVPTATAAPCIWTPNDMAYYLANDLRGLYWPAVPDPNFSSVVFLSHLDDKGSDNGNTRMRPPSAYPTDSDMQEKVGILVGGIMNGQRKFGRYGFLCGTSTYLVHNVSNAISLSSGDFTLEGWIYPNAATAGTVIWDTRTSTSDTTRCVIHLSNPGGKLALFKNGSDVIVDSGAIATGAWIHFAWCRSGSSNYLFKNGTQIGSTWTDSTNFGSTGTWHIGIAADNSSGPWSGYVDEFRVTVGVARYTSNFTAPIVPFPDY